MKYQTLGKTGYRVSAVTFGGIIVMDETQADAGRFVAGAVERGVNYFDVAPSYGNAQERLGPALAPYRSKVILACKTEKRDAPSSKKDLLASLKALRTERFDVYQLHAMTTQEDIDRAFGPDGAMETFLWAKKEGLVGALGFSAHNEDIALQLFELFDFDTVLFPMNWALGMARGWGDRISERAKKAGAGLIAMKTLVHRRWLDGEERVYPKSWCKPLYGCEPLMVAAMKYGLEKGAATLVPPGNFEHFSFMLDHIDECAENPLTGAERELLRREAEQVSDKLIF